MPFDQPTNQEMDAPVHPDPVRIDTPEHLAEDLYLHTPDGRRPSRSLLRRERWPLDVAVSVVVVACLGAILVAAGWKTFLIATVVAAGVWILAGAPVWRTALMRRREHEEIDETVEEAFHDATADTRVLREHPPYFVEPQSQVDPARSTAKSTSRSSSQPSRASASAASRALRR